MAKTKKEKTSSPSKLKLPPKTLVDFHLKSLQPILDHWSNSSPNVSKIPHSLLLQGPPGTGKIEMAHVLAQWIQCEGDRRPCQTCSNCRRHLSGQVIDLITIEALSSSGENSEKSEDKSRKIRMEQIRELHQLRGHGAHASAYRVFILRDAHLLTIQAANALLKLLEEPPNGWIFILTATDANLLPSTIVSRCQSLRLSRIPEDHLLKILEEEGIPSERRATCARLALGSWKRAIHFSEEAVWDRRRDILTFLQNPSTQLNELVEWGAKDHQNFQTLIDLLEHFNRDLLSLVLSPNKSSLSLANLDHQEKLQKMSSRKSISFLLKRSEELADIRSKLHLPLNQKSLTQSALLPWLNAD